jgi:hypothetical protein
MSEQKKGANNPFFGRKHSNETKRKQRDAMNGNKHLLGHKHSEETRRKMSEAQKLRYKKVVSQEITIPEIPEKEFYNA